uniref:Uncharacterized protein n=1 Tax=Myoviridae sp. ctkmZ20 TaxID=2825166 RepID=A0A8S5NSZ7_9CAUD|nr:MAG TPA: hypothetical protein [Myoviridae sp. ctkmZ20]
MLGYRVCRSEDTAHSYIRLIISWWRGSLDHLRL